jgi:hypothetical protein
MVHRYAIEFATQLAVGLSITRCDWPLGDNTLSGMQILPHFFVLQLVYGMPPKASPPAPA